MDWEEYKMDWDDFKLEFAQVALINNDAVTVYIRRSWWPRKCYLSGKSLWKHECVKLVRTVTSGHPELKPFKETYWIDSKEYMMFVLRYTK
jgi:hypothetical protein